MRDYQVSDRYARALLGLAESSQTLEKVEADFEQVIALLDKHPEISHLVSNSTISMTEKEDFVEKIFPQTLAKLLINFIKVLIQKKRFSLAREIRKQYHRLFEKKKGLQEVFVMTAVPLKTNTESKLISVLKKKLNAEVRLVQEVDSAILGGMILRFNGTEINSSFKDRLAELRQKLTI